MACTRRLLPATSGRMAFECVLVCASLGDPRCVAFKAAAGAHHDHERCVPTRVKKMLDFGVDGIISDRPDLVRKMMAERKMPLPLATPVTP